MSRARLIRTDSPVPSQSLKPEAVPAVKRYETLLEVALGADVAEHVQLLLVFSAHAFFLSVRTVETREFSGSTCVFPQPARELCALRIQKIVLLIGRPAQRSPSVCRVCKIGNASEDSSEVKN